MPNPTRRAVLLGGSTLLLASCGSSSTPTVQAGLSTAAKKRLDKNNLAATIQSVPGVGSVVLDDLICVGNVGAGQLSDCATQASQAWKTIRSITGVRPSTQALVLYAKDAATFSSWTGQDQGASGELGVAIQPQAWGVPGFVGIAAGYPVDPTQTLIDVPKYLGSTVQHELFHLATLPQDYQRVPMWITEGFAMWAGSQYALVFPASPPPATLPIDNSEFARDLQTYAYARSELFVAWLVAEFGQRKAMDFYTDAVKLNGPVEALFQRCFGESLRQSEKQWAAQYKNQIANLKVDLYEK